MKTYNPRTAPGAGDYEAYPIVSADDPRAAEAPEEMTEEEIEEHNAQAQEHHEMMQAYWAGWEP